jgi:hypothetical protein
MTNVFTTPLSVSQTFDTAKLIRRTEKDVAVYRNAVAERENLIVASFQVFAFSEAFIERQVCGRNARSRRKMFISQRINRA